MKTLFLGGVLISLSLFTGRSGAMAQAFPLLPTNQAGSASPLPTQTFQYETYTNETYGFTVQYPTSLLVPNSPITLEQGREFIAPTGGIQMVVYGQPQGDTDLNELYEDTLYVYGQRGAVIGQSDLGEDHFVVAGYDPAGVMFYSKMLVHNGNLLTLGIIYDNDLPLDMEFIVADIAASFQAIPVVEAAPAEAPAS